jgi:hypothetical protein
MRSSVTSVVFELLTCGKAWISEVLALFALSNQHNSEGKVRQDVLPNGSLGQYVSLLSQVPTGDPITLSRY